MLFSRCRFPRRGALWLAAAIRAADLVAGPTEPGAGRRAELRAMVAHHDDLYFRAAAPEISDADYDRLTRELAALEGRRPVEPQIGDDRNGRLAVRAHGTAMLSLTKGYTKADLLAFGEQIKRRLAQGSVPFVVEPKYDGVAISLVYERGELVRAVTRGDGRVGDDVTANVHRIASLPRRLMGVGQVPDLVELRGEVYLRLSEFARINAAREAGGEPPAAHPRNLAAGTIKASDAEDAEERTLSVALYGWGDWRGTPPPATQREFHEQVKAWGLPGAERVVRAETAAEAWEAVQALARDRPSLDYPIDGAVVKVDQVALQARLGASDHAPRWALACKFTAPRATTRLRGITLQVGRSGLVTPVAELEPVRVAGTVIRRVTLHNRAEIERLGLRIGDTVEVEKAGEVIPAIVGVDAARRPVGTRPFAFPAECPVCGVQFAVAARGGATRCENGGCAGRRSRRLEYFASASAVGLRGFGPGVIARLSGQGVLRSPADFYRLRRADLVLGGGMGEASADRLLVELAESRRRELWRFIAGLGIRQVGPASARKLGARCSDLRALAALGSAEAQAILGTGPAAGRLMEHLAVAENRREIEDLAAALHAAP